MNIDIKTVFVLLCLSNLMQIIVFYYQYRINKSMQGPGWWLLWNIAVFLSFSCMLIRTNPAMSQIAIALQDPLLILGMLFIYTGFSKFYEKPVNSVLISVIFVVFVVVHLFFLFIIDNITVRGILLYLFLALTSALSVYRLAFSRTAETASMAIFNLFVLLFNGLVFVYILLLMLTGTPHTEIFTSAQINLLQSFDAFFVNLLLTFGLISLINQRLNAEVTEAKAHFEQIFNTSPDIVTITRLDDGAWIAGNENFSMILGYNGSELTGHSASGIKIWHRSEDWQRLSAAVRESGAVSQFEAEFRKKDGGVFSALVSAQLTVLKGRLCVISIIHDISQRKKAEEALRVSEEKHRLLFENSPEGIVVIQNAKIVYLNPKISSLLGFDKEALSGRDFLQFIHADDRDLALSKYQGRLSGTVYGDRYHLRILKPQGEIRWAEISGIKMEWLGSPATLSFIKDITEQKEAEIELRSAKKNLEELNKEKDRFFSIIAHDLKSPFVGLLGLTQIFAESIETFSVIELKELGADMHKTASNLFELLKNLLEWSQMKQGMFPFNPAAFPISRVITSNIEALTQRSIQKGIKIIYDDAEDLWVCADERMISSVVLNLISNAVKFTFRRGTINISARKLDDSLAEISVKDTGIGLAENDLRSLFLLGSKVSSAGTEGEVSTGLGLLLCKEFVEKHGGRIYAESIERKGSRFSFTLPLKQNE